MLNTQLTKVYFDEILKDAAEARIERNAQPAHAKISGRETFFALAAAGVPFIVWLTQVFRTK